MKDNVREKQMNLPEEGVPKIWCCGPEGFLSDGGDTQSRTSEDDQSVQVGVHMREGSPSGTLALSHTGLGLESNWEPAYMDQGESYLVSTTHSSRHSGCIILYHVASRLSLRAVWSTLQ